MAEDHQATSEAVRLRRGVVGATVALVLVSACAPGQLVGDGARQTDAGQFSSDHRSDASTAPGLSEGLGDAAPDGRAAVNDGGRADGRTNPDADVGDPDSRPPALDSRPANDVQQHDVGPVDDKTWVVVFSYLGPKLPDKVVAYACDEELPRTEAWIAEQAARYGVSLPYSQIRCLDGQFALPSSVLDKDGKTDFHAAFDHLKGQISDLSTAKYVTIVSAASDYKGGSARMISRVVDVFPVKLTFVNDLTLVHPGTDEGAWARTFAHEFMHKLGATDKYNTTPDTACLRNRLTGEYYSGYDIMCHRLQVSPGAYTMTPLDQCRVTLDTALETNWEPYPSSTDRIQLLHPTGGETWYAGELASYKFITQGLQSGTIDVSLLRGGQTVDQWSFSTIWENSPSYIWWNYAVPATMEAGHDYTLRLCDGKHPSVCAESPKPFSIKK